jgi:arylsulfatase
MNQASKSINRGLAAGLAAVGIALGAAGFVAPASAQTKKPNILVIWGDDVGWSNVSAYNMGMMGYRTPNVDRLADEGMLFTDYYAQQSCTAGRAAFITGVISTNSYRQSMDSTSFSALSTI